MRAENEADIMKDVPNWEVRANVYHKTWMRPLTRPAIDPIS